MKSEIEKNIDSIVQGIPIDRRGVWHQVFEEKVVGKSEIPMSDLKALEADAKCFELLKTGGIIKSGLTDKDMTVLDELISKRSAEGWEFVTYSVSVSATIQFAVTFKKAK